MLNFNFNSGLLPDESELEIDSEEKVLVDPRKCGMLWENASLLRGGLTF